MGQQPVMQYSFNSGEWAPALNARVDIAKYHSGAALLRNFFVDYRGGATTRSGTKYIIQTFGTGTVRLIPFQASLTVSYILEFGEQYIRFINSGAPVLEAGIAITGVTQANPCVVTVANTYTVGDWVFISGVAGMTQLNGNYYIISARNAATITLQDLFGVPLNSTSFGAWTSGGAVQRVYKIASPYTAAELAQLKFTQNVNTLIICHPNHVPQQLTLLSAANWTIGAINFGSTISAPVGQAVATTLAGGTVNYAYVITAVDANGQESAPSAFAVLANVQDIRTVLGTNTVTWTAVTGAVSYNIYKAEPRVTNPVPPGAQFGFVGNCTATTFIDSNINQDFSQGTPVPLNPFSGSGVASVNLTSAGNYANQLCPTPTFTGGGGAGAAATAYARCSIGGIAFGGTSYIAGDVLTSNISGFTAIVTGVGAFGTVSSISLITAGTVSSGSICLTQATMSNPRAGQQAILNMNWPLVSIGITNPGTGYGAPPAVGGFGGGGGAAVAVLGAPSNGNPTVPGLFQQRLVLAGPVLNPQQINFSSTSQYYNFDEHNPVEADDAIQATLVSGQLNTIQSMISQPQGLIVLSDKQAWLINGGSPGSAISPLAIVANAQAYNGASYPPPIVATNDVLYVQSKGSIVRDLVFNFYTQVYTGTDITVLSSHLFVNNKVLEWAWAEEPFKLVWAVRNDGIMLILTFLKEQELVAWTHSDTQGLFASVASVVENAFQGTIDAVYTVVKRSINGAALQYIERVTELYYPSGVVDAWNVDAGLQYNGSAVLTFNGAQHLSGLTITGLATDDLNNVRVITPFVMPVNQTGTFTLPAPPAPATGYTRVTIGLSYLPQLQTLAIDLGEPTVQGKRKKITGVTVRVKDALGLSIGGNSSSLVPMKDLVVGNVGSATNTVVTGLVTADVRTIIEPNWTVQGQYFIQQSNPYPASILGVIPEISVGDTK